MRRTVMIVEDHAFTAQGLTHALSANPDLEVVSTVHDGISAVSDLKRLQPDCAILDLQLPDATGMEVFAEGKRWSPKTRFAILTGNPATAVFANLMADGINGIFLKYENPDEICAGIARIAAGEDVFGAGVLELLRSNNGEVLLTARETEVLQEIARGQTNAQMAERLGISPKTVDSHRTSLMRKLSVRSTASLIVRAMNSGLIDVSHPTPSSGRATG